MNIFYRILLELAYFRFYISRVSQFDRYATDRVKYAVDLMRTILHNVYWRNLSDDDKKIVRKMLKIRLNYGVSSVSDSKNREHDFNEQISAIKNSECPNIFTIFYLYRKVSKIIAVEKIEPYGVYSSDEPVFIILRLLKGEADRIIGILYDNRVLTRCKQAVIF